MDGKKKTPLIYFISNQIQIKFLKSHILQSHKFKDVTELPPHKNLVPEIKKLPPI
jgi:hypothetical protein